MSYRLSGRERVSLQLGTLTCFTYPSAFNLTCFLDLSAEKTTSWNSEISSGLFPRPSYLYCLPAVVKAHDVLGGANLSEGYPSASKEGSRDR